MPFFILEPAEGTSRPSGTSVIQDHTRHRSATTQAVLVPSPSDSPFDPLNWPRYRKELLFAVVLFGSCTTGSLGPLLVPGFTDLAEYFDLGITNITLLNGSLVMSLGVSAYLCCSLAEVFGKRLVYISTTGLLLISCCWAAASTSYTSLLASRVFQGLGMGGFFALAGTSTLNDVFFVHERGLRVGLWNFAIIVSVNLTPVISGYVISNMSWKWSFWLEAIMFGLALAAVVLLFPETTYHRGNGHSIIEGQTPTLPTSNLIVSPKQTLDLSDDKSAKLPASPRSEVIQSGSRPSWRYFLGLGPVRFGNTNRLFAACIKPTTLLLHPIVLWGCVMWSVTFTWTILLGAVVSQIFGAPPYNMNTVAVGNLTGIAPFIGSALGTVFGGWACDKVVQTLATRNNGVYEPEFRLLVIFVATVALALGSFGLGGAIRVGLSANACGFFMAVINFGVGVGCTGIVTYTNDVCGERAGDAFGLAMVTKSAFAFGLTFILNDYYAQSGPLVFFATFGAVTVGVMLTTLPMYVFGKKIRVWGDSHGLLGSKMA